MIGSRVMGLTERDSPTRRGLAEIFHTGLLNTGLQPLVSTQVAGGRSGPVPEGHLRIAQRFSVGYRFPEAISPEGTADAGFVFSRPFGTRADLGRDPNAEALGYSQMSLRDMGASTTSTGALGSRLLRLGIGVIGLLCCLGCNRLPGKPAPADIALKPQQVTDFTVLYQQNCSGCHGRDGGGSGALALNNPIFLAIANDEALRQAIDSGVPGTLMPAFLNSAGGTLTDKQIDILVREMRLKWSKPAEVGRHAPPSYVASASGNASHGAEVYATFCASCHGNNGNGTLRASSIVDGSYLALVSDQDLRVLVIAGRPDLRHPDWRNYVPDRVMTAQEVTDVVAWLGSKRPAYPGQPYPDKQ